VLELSQKTGQMVLTDAEIAQRLPIDKDMPDLHAVVILPLKWKDLGLGVFWVAFHDNQSPSNEEVNYLKELAQMGSMAIVNAKTYEDSQNSLGLMETVFELLPDAVLITDQHGQVLFHNQHAGEILGVDNRLLEGKPLSTLFSAEDSVQLSGAQSFHGAFKEVRLKNGKAFNLIKRPIRVNPRMVGQVMIFKDVTEQVQEDSLKSEFVTTVSHELRSPLSLILGYAKILRLTGNLNDQQDVYLGKIIAGVEEMKSLVQKLLDIGRLEGGDALNISKFTVEEIITRVIESMEAHAKQKNIHISTNLPNFPLTLEGDQTFITQALKNLLENAIKFSKMEGEVILSANQKGERVIFSVQDKGIGIAPLDQRNLFQKFSRANAHTGIEAEGSGLGLAIVKTIAERHGGRVWLESQLGKGSTFYIEIPRQQP
jgi:PAS domain S-box-containing protein